MTGARWFISVLAAAAMLAFCGAASAETVTLGPPTLGYAPSGQGCSGMCTDKVYAQITAGPGALAAAPRSGRITSWRVHRFTSLNGSGAFRLRVLRPVSAGALESVGRSEPAQFEDGLTANPTDLPIAAGDLIGVEILSLDNSPANYLVTVNDAGGGSFLGYNNFGDGDVAGTTDAPSTGMLQVNATVELDPVPPPPDIERPRISLLTLAPAAFQAANSGPTLVAAVVGTQVVYELSEAATLNLTVERAAKGQRRKGKCSKPKRGANGKKCTRYVAVKGSANHAGKAGLNKLRFMGRLGGKQLKPGKYRLVAVATDAAGNQSKPKRKRFRILR